MKTERKRITPQAKSKGFFDWAYNRSDSAHPKYSTKIHAIYITATGTFLFCLVSWLSRNLIFDTECGMMRPSAPYVGYFILFYLCLMIGSRYYENGSVVIYEFLWACNMSLLVGSYSMIIGDSHLLRGTMIVVGLDQILWYVDLISYILFKKFPVGVAKYLIWKETTLIRKMTTFHHIIYIPLVMWLTYPSASSCGLSLKVYFLSCTMALALALIGRISTPKELTVIDINAKKKDDSDSQGPQTRTLYMNLNISWELWKDVKIGILQRSYQVVPSFMVPFVLSILWNIGAFIGFVILYCIQSTYA